MHCYTKDSTFHCLKASNSCQLYQEIYQHGSSASSACSWSIAYLMTNKYFFYLEDLNYDQGLPNFRGSPAEIQEDVFPPSRFPEHLSSTILDCCLRLLKAHNQCRDFRQYYLTALTCKTCKDSNHLVKYLLLPFCEWMRAYSRLLWRAKAHWADSYSIRLIICCYPKLSPLHAKTFLPTHLQQEYFISQRCRVKAAWVIQDIKRLMILDLRHEFSSLLC